MTAALAALGLWLAAPPAAAHGTFAGEAGFYAGALHPVTAVPHLLALLALGLLLGRAGQARGGWPLGALAAGLGAGLALGGLEAPADGAAQAVLVLALVLGLLLAAGRPTPTAANALLALGVGLAIGLDTDAVAGGTATDVAAGAAGVYVGLFLLVLNAMALSSWAASGAGPVLTIGLRAAGSWIAAAGLMVLALQLRPLAAGG